MPIEIEYRILTGYFASWIEQEVRRLSGEGWRPCGGLSMAPDADGSILLAQAMQRETFTLDKKHVVVNPSTSVTSVRPVDYDLPTAV